MLLLARSVHAESLVGETQAWLTRPYEWKKLLAAKVLFCVAYVFVPLLCAQCLLLHLAGFAPHAFLGELAYKLCLTSAFFVLPLVAIAVITPNFARMTLTLLGVLIGTIGLGMLLAWRHRGDLSSGPSPTMMTTLLVAWLCLSMFAIALQYARRRTWLVRGLLSLPLFVFLVFALYVRSPQVEADYPQGSSPLVKLDFAPTVAYPVHGYVRTGSEDVELQVPVLGSVVPDGYAAKFNLLRVTMDGPGVHWQSAWQQDGGQMAPAPHQFNISFTVKRAMYEQLRGKSLEMHVDLALTRLRAVSTSVRTLGVQDFSVPEDGYCALNPLKGSLLCRYALSEPRLTYLQVDAAPGGCDDAPQVTSSQHMTGAT